MRAMVVTRYGPPEVIQEQDMPEPVVGEYDLLVEVRAAGMNPLDAKIRQCGSCGPRAFPFIAGYDVSGVVRSMGARAAGFAVGDEVYASPSRLRNGADAELVCVDARTAAHKPSSIDHIHAAALPLVSLTAWESLYERAVIQQDETVLIHAGGGGVGHIAIQLAKARGCRVLTTASSSESIRLCNEVGADVIINYRQEDVTKRVREETGGQGAPAVLDAVGGKTFGLSLDCLAVNGRLVSLEATTVNQLVQRLSDKNATLHMEMVAAPARFGIHPQKHGQILRQIAEMVDAGGLRPHVSNIMRLDELVRAHCLQEKGHVPGKIVLQVH